jgi:hypothetical protein
MCEINIPPPRRRARRLFQVEANELPMETFLLVRSRDPVKWIHGLWRKRLLLIPKNRTALSGFMKINFLVSYIFPIGTLESSVKLAIWIIWGELHRLATVWRSLQAMDIRSTRVHKNENFLSMASCSYATKALVLGVQMRARGHEYARDLWRNNITSTWTHPNHFSSWCLFHRKTLNGASNAVNVVERFGQLDYFFRLTVPEMSIWMVLLSQVSYLESIKLVKKSIQWMLVM